MSLVRCTCGCTVFETIQTVQYYDTDFRIWSSTSRLTPEVTCIQVAKCIKCGRIKIPSTSMAGKNSTDPEVRAYAELIPAVEAYNNKVTSIEDSLVKVVYNSLLDDRVAKLESKANELKDLEVACIGTIGNGEVTEIVEATKRGRKSTKSSV